MIWYAWIAVIVAVALQAADIVTTSIILGYGGKEVGVAALFVKAGWPRWAWMTLFKLIFVAITYVAYRYSGENGMLAFIGSISAVTAWGVTHNIGQIRAHYE